MIDPNKPARELTAQELHELLLSVFTGAAVLTGQTVFMVHPKDLRDWPGPFSPTGEPVGEPCDPGV